VNGKKIVFSTERLRLREFELKDAKFIVELLNSPGWLKCIGDRNVKTITDAENYLKNGPLTAYQKYGYGLSMAEKIEGDEPIGMCGIIIRPKMALPDIGFALLPNFEGMGFGVEIAKATIEYSKTHLFIAKICAITTLDNLNSMRLLEKIGMNFIKVFIDEISGEE
jgi:RimJ/RimL family protein N-acetyltransferase